MTYAASHMIISYIKHNAYKALPVVVEARPCMRDSDETVATGAVAGTFISSSSCWRGGNPNVRWIGHTAEIGSSEIVK